ncbi:GNAT family N-acetyltransferase [Novosphingobium piscinae]|uniref:GNAT family N-acetyltransferase n=1 Tax=Novosphingobium piscinae TaxID=1507448 RepID=A0A7X1FW42_9SPHN|nr:GNAT family N-acetyltransferase [Novosphingobium piscinae]MBC2668046.1 GNAT family N-acetyltransferase [Novosphingobium piscinae]
MIAALDFPVWHGLTGPQAHLARRHGQALRIVPDYGPFAAAPGDARGDLAGLLAATDELWLVEPEAFAAPPGTRVIRTAPLVQMVADGPVDRAADDPEIVALDEGDAAAMTALAEATRPGPWGPATRRYGPFYGIRREGRLAAMAGERLRPAAGLAEVSGVCAWPEFRGQGLAARLIRRVVAGFAARGDQAFLHSYAANASAIRLYETLGFRIRRGMVVTVLGAAA